MDSDKYMYSILLVNYTLLFFHFTIVTLPLILLTSLIFLLEGMEGTEHTKQKILNLVRCCQFSSEAWTEMDYDMCVRI